MDPNENVNLHITVSYQPNIAYRKNTVKKTFFPLFMILIIGVSSGLKNTVI